VQTENNLRDMGKGFMLKMYIGEAVSNGKD
jgi:hypothetical protein